MVHVLCINGNCGRVLHLSSLVYWNYEGEATCPNCECTFMLAIKDGEVISAKPIGAP